MNRCEAITCRVRKIEISIVTNDTSVSPYGSYHWETKSGSGYWWMTLTAVATAAYEAHRVPLSDPTRRSGSSAEPPLEQHIHLLKMPSTAVTWYIDHFQVQCLQDFKAGN